jgi:hypothetical protein
VWVPAVAVQILHVGKCGGTAIRHAIREARAAAGGRLDSPWGPIWARQGHRYKLSDVPEGDKAVFVLRDPATRFVSGFYSRLRKGRPRHFREWSDEERRAFDWFTTPEALAEALAARGEERKRAEFAMRTIRQVRRPMTQWTGSPEYLLANLDKVLYIARQETLDDDWANIKELLGLPPTLTLPQDEVGAHRTVYPREQRIGERGLAALRDWFEDDYRLLEIAEDFRAGRAPAPARGLTTGARRVARRLRQTLS